MYPNPKPGIASAIPIHRPLELASSVIARSGAIFKPMPGWGENFASTAFLNEWNRSKNGGGANCVTFDPDEARATDKILIPRDRPYRIVMNAEDADVWDPNQYAKMEADRASLAAVPAYRHLILSAFVGGARQLLARGITLDDFLRHEDQYRNFASPFHEISPCIYFDPGDDAANTMQARMLNAWRNTLAPGKPLSPVVWRFNKVARRNCTVPEWRIQIEAAKACLATRAIIMWDDLNGPAQQRDYDLWAAAMPRVAI